MLHVLSGEGRRGGGAPLQDLPGSRARGVLHQQPGRLARGLQEQGDHLQPVPKLRDVRREDRRAVLLLAMQFGVPQVMRFEPESHPEAGARPVAVLVLRHPRLAGRRLADRRAAQERDPASQAAGHAKAPAKVGLCLGRWFVQYPADRQAGGEEAQAGRRAGEPGKGRDRPGRRRAGHFETHFKRDQRLRFLVGQQAVDRFRQAGGVPAQATQEPQHSVQAYQGRQKVFRPGQGVHRPAARREIQLYQRKLPQADQLGGVQAVLFRAELAERPHQELGVHRRDHQTLREVPPERVLEDRGRTND